MPSIDRQIRKAAKNHPSFRFYRTVLNPDEPREKHLVLTFGKKGQPLVEPIKQRRGSYVGMTVEAFNICDWYPDAAKVRLAQILEPCT